MMCETGCSWKISSVVQSIDGVGKVEVDFNNKILLVEYDNQKTSDEKIITTLSNQTIYIDKKVDKNKVLNPIYWFKNIFN